MDVRRKERRMSQQDTVIQRGLCVPSVFTILQVRTDCQSAAVLVFICFASSLMQIHQKTTETFSASELVFFVVHKGQTTVRELLIQITIID